MGPKAARPAGGSRIRKEGQPDVYRIGGQDVPCDPELAVDRPRPQPLFPKYEPNPPKPLTAKEKIQIARFRSLRESIHNGPLYTILGDNLRVTKPGEKPKKAAASFNAFEGMSKYSQRYTRRRRQIPKLDTRPYVLKFFPQELHSTLDPSTAITRNGTTNPSTTKPKLLTIPGYEKVTNDDDVAEAGPDDEGEEKAPKDPDEEDPLMGEDVDDEYEDDEDGGDYNAEQYFDDGGDDGGDDYDGGGDDGGGGYID